MIGDAAIIDIEEGVLTMKNMKSVVELLKREHSRLVEQIQGVSAALAAFGSTYSNGSGRRTISAAGRARIAAAQRKRWAEVRAKSTGKGVRIQKRRTLSASARAKIAAAQKARWAKAAQ
jgi:hypothetical protein